MRKYTQKELREYIRLKLARDLTTVDPEELPRHYEKIGYSRGIYGLNGGLVQDKDTGEFNPEQDGPEDIEGYSIYCTSYKVQEEIAAYEGVKPEEVKLYEFSGFSKIPVYKAV